MNRLFGKIWLGVKTVYEKEWVKILFTFSFIFSCFAIVYFFTDKLVGLDDPLFHIRFAEILREKGFGAFKDFHWLYFSKISQDQTYFIYYNFLFYLALIPFTFMKSLIVGIKLYGIINFSLAFTALYYFLLKLNIKKPFFWIIIFLALINYGSLTRFLVARPYTLAPALLILELFFLYKKKYFGVFLLSLLYVFWHTATFFFPLMVSAVFCVFENFYGRKPDLKLFFMSLLGTIIAVGGIVLFTPGFIIYMKDIIFGNVYNTAISKAISIKEGMELYPINFFDYIASNIQTMILFIVAVVFEIYQYIQVRAKNISHHLTERLQPLKSSLFFLSLLFFAGNFFTQRNGDFYVFFSVAYIAISFDYIFNYIEFKDRGVKISLLVASSVVIGYLFVGNMLFIVSRVAQGGSIETFKGTADWLKNNTDKNEVIFNPTWSWFTQLFYYNPDDYYVAGIEPKFFYDYNPELYWTWQNISDYGYLCSEEKCDEINKKYYSTGLDSSVSSEEKKKWRQEESSKMADYIKNVFHSRFVVTSNEFVIFNLAMSSSSRFEKVFTDSVYGVFIYKIN